MDVGHGLDSCTTNVQHAFIDIVDHPHLGNNRIVILDTPGFDNTHIEDEDIMRRIAIWLASS
jgi:hypothetical protein